MKTLIIFEDVSDEPMEPLLLSVREVLDRHPAFDAGAISIPTFRAENPSISIKEACFQIFAAVQAGNANRAALFMPSKVHDQHRTLLFQGQLVLFSTRTHLFK